MTPADAVAALERVAARDVGRGSAALSRRTAGALRRAADSLLAEPTPEVAILTGCYIPTAHPPAAETDGPLGAIQLAAAIGRLGGAARLVTDEPCAPVVAAAIDTAGLTTAGSATAGLEAAGLIAAGPEAAGLKVPLDVAPLAGYDGWQAATLAGYPELTHVISCERVGPAADGVPHDMRGVDLGAHSAPLDRLYGAGPWYRIGIGDGGNELGMGVLATGLVAAAVDRGAEIHCVTGCEALIVAGTSNWGAAALVGALAVLADDREPLIELLSPDWSRAVLDGIVGRAGAVDGVRRTASPSVDGLDWPAYAEPLAEIERIVRLTG
ncbi:DUF4392 domain-containing protein [Solwaraspora sp. WMMD1047]|uniref:glutamate cyclase domain-containing protein n=1 Tax=Solwaraspora sp. WMMD1047 TaxID=3016102 RepID=UPI00241734D2|nr:glutamate cyclase domain-containing protein [Solwaraspora sp. WMMD1047]MDG4829560.1 DUF4392 domain-containing protein [Solwaraspora sp. WMMD1047]